MSKSIISPSKYIQDGGSVATYNNYLKKYLSYFVVIVYPAFLSCSKK